MRCTQGWIPKPQFLYPPLRLESQQRMPKPLFFLVFWVYTTVFDFLLLDEFLLRPLSPKFGSQHQLRIKTLLSLKIKVAGFNVPNGRGCLGERCQGLPGQVWDLRFLPSFPSFPRENHSSRMLGKKRLEVPDTLLPDILDQPT